MNKRYLQITLIKDNFYELKISSNALWICYILGSSNDLKVQMYLQFI